MEPWRAKAVELLPELEEMILSEDVYRPMSLWIELSLVFQHAYEGPRNEGLIERIYRYAFWGLASGERHPTDAGQDVPTCVCIAFLEEIPTIAAARLDMPRWFTRQEVIDLREVLTYHDTDWDRLLALFPVPMSNRRARREARKASRQPRPWAKG